MQKLLIISYIFILLGGMQSLPAQDTLRLEDAIQLALQNNYSIQAAKYNVETSRINAHPGNTGLLPAISLNGGANYSRSNVEVQLLNNEGGPNAPATISQEVDGIETYSYNYGVGLNYTVFDGLGNVYNYRVLQTNVDLSREQTRTLIEQQISQVANAYYQLARQRASYGIQQEAVNISRERLNRIGDQFEFGSTNRLAVLNAEVDLNTDSANLETIALNLENAQRNLNLLLGIDLAEDNRVSRNVSFPVIMNQDAVVEQALNQNAELRAAEINQKVSQLNLQLEKSGRMPRLDINANYGYNFQDNGPVNFLQQLESWGVNLGATVSVPLFNGNRVSRNIQRATISVDQADIQYEQIAQQVERDVLNAYDTYQNSLRILRLEQKSLEAASENFERTRETYSLGQATSTQFREAQLNLLRVQNRINDLRYDTKLYEIEVLRLSGQLVPEI